MNPEPKLLWGFGRAGWVLLVVAVALALCLVTGYDLRFQLLRLIAALFGTQAMMEFVAALTMHSVDILVPPYAPTPRFGLPAMCACLVALQVHPARLGWWRYAMVSAAGVLIPAVEGRLAARVIFPHLVPPGVLFDANAMNWAFGLAAGALATVTVVITAFVFKSRWVTLSIGALLIAGLIESIEAHRLAFGLPPMISSMILDVFPHGRWVWYLAFCAVVTTWAAMARRSRRQPGACRACNYDLRGLTTNTCPECGARVSAAEPLSTVG